MTSAALCLDESSAAVRHGTRDYRRVSVALFLAGFSTFSLLYAVQPLLPAFAAHFRIDPATSALALSLSTAALGVAIVLASVLAHRFSRRGMMFTSMTMAAVLNLAVAIAPDWHMLLAGRLLEGFALGGVPAIAMAYLAEEVDPRDLGKAMGLYVAGTAFGGMIGRVGIGVLADLLSWRGAMAALGVADLVAAIGFFLLLPPARRTPVLAGAAWRGQARQWRALLAHGALLRLFAVGFVLTSVFVALFNYAGFRLAAAPYRLGEAAVSAIFLVYAVGILGSSWAGRLADRFGPRRPLVAGLVLLAAGVLLTLSAALPVIVAGIACATLGFFVAHAVASGWVGRLAGSAKAPAASLYLLFYYAGSSITGAGAGWFYKLGGWPLLVALIATIAIAGIALAASGRARPLP